MKITLATSAGDIFGHIFAEYYRRAGGPKIDSIIELETRSDVGIRQWRFLCLYKLFGINGIISLTKLKYEQIKKTNNLMVNRWPIAMISLGRTGFSKYKSINDDSTIKQLKKDQPDILVSISVPNIIKSHILRIAKIGSINLHNGMLPKYRGHFGTFWEVKNREKWGYICIHEMNDKVDAGKLLAYDRVNIFKSKSFLDLMIDKKKRGGIILAKLLRSIESKGAMPDEVHINENITKLKFDS